MVETYTVEVRKRIAASARRVYDAWLTAADWDQWFTSNSQIDPRVGGKYINGDHDTGTYLELVPAKLIRFTWDNPSACPGSEVEITFVAVNEDVGAANARPVTSVDPTDAGRPWAAPTQDDGKMSPQVIEVYLRHTKLQQPEAGRGEMIDGWGWALDNLAAYLEGGEKTDHDTWVARKYGD